MSAKNQSESTAAAPDNTENAAESASAEMTNEDNATPTPEADEQATVNEVSNLSDTDTESDFQVNDKRRFVNDLEVAAEADDDDDEVADDDDDDDVAFSSTAEDAFEIDLDQIKLDSEETEREVAQLRAKLKETEQRLKDTEALRGESVKLSEEYADRFRKAQVQLRAETDEMRARLQRTFEQRLEIARGDVVASLLDTLDNLQRAVAAAEVTTDQEAAFAALHDGIKATAEMFENQLKKMGLQIVSSEGEPFNPEVHDAVEIAVVEKDQDGLVLAELQRGYKFNERLLRPARVKVGRTD